MKKGEELGKKPSSLSTLMTLKVSSSTSQTQISDEQEREKQWRVRKTSLKLAKMLARLSKAKQNLTSKDPFLFIPPNHKGKEKMDVFN